MRVYNKRSQTDNVKVMRDSDGLKLKCVISPKEMYKECLFSNRFPKHFCSLPLVTYSLAIGWDKKSWSLHFLRKLESILSLIEKLYTLASIDKLLYIVVRVCCTFCDWIFQCVSNIQKHLATMPVINMRKLAEDLDSVALSIVWSFLKSHFFCFDGSSLCA